MSYLNRRATRYDLPAIQQLILDASVDGVGIGGTQSELHAWQKVNASLDLLASRLSKEDTLVLVAESSFKSGGSTQIVGTAYATVKDDKIGYLGGLYCSLRGQGVGTGLLKELEEWLRVNGARSIEMAVSEKNAHMIGLSTKLGYYLKHQVNKDDFFRNATWLILTKKL